MFLIFLIFAQNIDCGYTLAPRGSNECIQSMFRSKNTIIGIPPHTPVLLIKVGFKGVFISQTCFRDVMEQGAEENFKAAGERGHFSRKQGVKTSSGRG